MKCVFQLHPIYILDANVFLTIYGENADSGERPLLKSENRNKFERNQVSNN